jgi:hypothetical protein
MGIRVRLLMELAVDAVELVSRLVSDVRPERSGPVVVASSEVSVLSSELVWDWVEDTLEGAGEMTDENRLLVWEGNPGCADVVGGLPNVCVGWVSPGSGCVCVGNVCVGEGCPGCSVVVTVMAGLPPVSAVCVTVTVQCPFASHPGVTGFGEVPGTVPGTPTVCVTTTVQVSLPNQSHHGLPSRLQSQSFNHSPRSRLSLSGQRSQNVASRRPVAAFTSSWA